MATRIEKWADSEGTLWDTEAEANRADLIRHIEEFLNQAGGSAYDFNTRRAAEELIDSFVLTPRVDSEG